MEENNNHAQQDELVPHLMPMAEVMNKLVLEGYEDVFKVDESGEELVSVKTERTFTPDQIKIKNYFRFEGQSDPNDQEILYVIETSDGLKGTIVDAYGPYSDRQLAQFITKVQDIFKKTSAHH